VLPRLSARTPIVFACWLALPAPASGYPHPGGLVDGAHLAALRARTDEPAIKAARDQLLSAAMLALQEPPSAVATFNVPAYYLAAAAHTAEKKKLSDDALAAYTCALAYQLEPASTRVPYAEKARQLLQAWATTNKKVAGFDGDLVMCYAGTPLVFAAELLSDYAGWSAAERTSFRSWAGNVFRGSANEIKQKSNNWGDWGTLGAIATAHLLDESASLKAEIERLRGKIGSAIASDGHLPAETARGKNGMWYTFFALAPMTAAATIARHAEGQDLLAYVSANGRSLEQALLAYVSANGRSLEQALDFFFPYCQQPGAWPWGEQDDLPTVGDWPGNLFEVMSAVYARPAWESWVSAARPVRGSRGWIFASLLRPLPAPSPDDRPPDAGPSLATDLGVVTPSPAASFDGGPEPAIETGGGCSLPPARAEPAGLLFLLPALSLIAIQFRRRQLAPRRPFALDSAAREGRWSAEPRVRSRR
jgi:hypothetical protein